MEPQELKTQIEQAIISVIAERVVERFIERQKEALVLFTGATIGFSQAIESLNALQADGWKLKIVMSRAAERVLGKSLVQRLLGIEEIVTEDSGTDSHVLAKGYKFILVPSLSINSAAKVAHNIGDNLVTDTIAYGLQKGKYVIAAINACCPDNAERAQIGFGANEAYRRQMTQNIETMRAHGVSVTISESLYQKTQRAFAKSLRSEFSGKIQRFESAGERVSASQRKEIAVQDRIISRARVVQNQGNDRMIVPKNAIITALAQEEANRLNIKLIRE